MKKKRNSSHLSPIHFLDYKEEKQSLLESVFTCKEVANEIEHRHENSLRIDWWKNSLRAKEEYEFSFIHFKKNQFKTKMVKTFLSEERTNCDKSGSRRLFVPFVRSFVSSIYNYSQRTTIWIGGWQLNEVWLGIRVDVTILNSLLSDCFIPKVLLLVGNRLAVMSWSSEN